MITDTQVLMRLILATAFSGLIGFEREFHGRAAGFRTHILLCIGSALIMLTSIHIFELYNKVAPCDPGRIAAGVVTGIGFLGAGTIMRFKVSVKGLTTAASLWVVSGIGLAVGAGMIKAALFTTLLALIALFFFSKLEYMILRKDWYRMLVIETREGAKQLINIRQELTNYEAEIKDLEILKADEPGDVLLKFNLKLPTSRNDEKIRDAIERIDGVRKTRWENV
ncbi:MAG: MgtC/SapB family protein [Candidatus Omnitrophota bacterium]